MSGNEKSSANMVQVGGNHYRVDPIQHWDLVVANEIPYLEAVAIKYLMRHRRKNGKQDLEKAKHYIEKMIEVYYPENTDQSLEGIHAGPDKRYTNQD